MSHWPPSPNAPVLPPPLEYAGGEQSTPVYPLNTYPPPEGYPLPEVMTQQPQAVVGYPPVGSLQYSGIPGCPPGLEYLATIDQFVVQQKIDIIEIVSGLDQKNEYNIKNNQGQDIYVAKEESTFCERGCYGTCRPFTMKIIDNYGREVIHMMRDLNCDCCCCPCCLQEMEIMSPPGTLVSKIIQEWSCMGARLRIENESGETVLKVKGPRCPGCGCSDVDFDVLSKDDVKIGKVTKQWTGFAQEASTNADNFSISFPMDLHVKEKAALLGALFLIDFMYFEAPNKKRRRV